MYIDTEIVLSDDELEILNEGGTVEVTGIHTLEIEDREVEVTVTVTVSREAQKVTRLDIKF